MCECEVPFSTDYHSLYHYVGRHPAACWRRSANVDDDAETDSNHPASGCQPVSAIIIIIHRGPGHTMLLPLRGAVPVSRRHQVFVKRAGKEMAQTR